LFRRLSIADSPDGAFPMFLAVGMVTNSQSGEPLGEPLGRFWAIASDSDDEDDVSGGSPPSPLSARASAYLCRSPEPVSCDLPFESSAALKKKEQKRRLQREMARMVQGMDSPVFSSPSRSTGTSTPKKKLPVLSPSTFLLDFFDAEEWVLVQRKWRKVRQSYRLCGRHFVSPRAFSPAFRGSASSPACSLDDQRHCGRSAISKNSRMGQLGLNARRICCMINWAWSADPPNPTN
jgi:hypothetical protein